MPNTPDPSRLFTVADLSTHTTLLATQFATTLACLLNSHVPELSAFCLVSGNSC